MSNNPKSEINELFDNIYKNIQDEKLEELEDYLCNIEEIININTKINTNINLIDNLITLIKKHLNLDYYDLILLCNTNKYYKLLQHIYLSYLINLNLNLNSNLDSNLDPILDTSLEYLVANKIKSTSTVDTVDTILSYYIKYSHDNKKILEGYTRLINYLAYNAIYNDNISKLHHLEEYGLCYSILCKNERDILGLAITFGYIEIVKYLIDMGFKLSYTISRSNIYNHEYEVFANTCYNNYLDMVKYLHLIGLKKKHTLYCIKEKGCIYKHDNNFLEYFISKGYKTKDLCGKGAMIVISESGYLDNLKILVERLNYKLNTRNYYMHVNNAVKYRHVKYLNYILDIVYNSLLHKKITIEEYKRIIMKGIDRFNKETYGNMCYIEYDDYSSSSNENEKKSNYLNKLISVLNEYYLK